MNKNNIRITVKENKLYVGDYEGHKLLIGDGIPWMDSSIEFLLDADKLFDSICILK